MKIDREELAYAGGLFEGEGCIAQRTQGTKPYYLSLNMTDLEPIQRFQVAVGGLGKIYGPRRCHPDHKEQWDWQCTRFEHNQAVLAMLWPWLGPRRRARAIELATR
jgi:hypothetical protein